MGRFSLNPFRRRKPAEERDISTVDQFINAFQFAGNWYTPSSQPVQTTMGKNVVSSTSHDFVGYSMVAARNGVVSSCLDVRQSVFSATRFQWQKLNRGRPSEMFGDTSLLLLERPWPGGTTQDLLSRMIQDADLAGNSYWVKKDAELVRLRPDWVDIILSPRVMRDGIVGFEVAGYLYTEDGHGASAAPVPFLPDEVAHFMPRPDPLAPWRGMSWLTPVVRSEITTDQLMTEHKRAFFENAATPNMVVSLAREVGPDAFEKFVSKMDSSHKGVQNAYKTMYLGGGADVTVVGSDFQQMSFTQVQGAGETRIAAAAGVPPVIVGLSEGLQAATYSNYAQARRRFADGTIHPLWQNAVGSLEHLVKPPGLSSAIRLWYDSRDVPFLREDQKDASEIQHRKALTIRQLTDAGYTPESVSHAVESEDLSLLEHTGLFSVMLMPPGTVAKPPSAEPTEGTA